MAALLSHQLSVFSAVLLLCIRSSQSVDLFLNSSLQQTDGIIHISASRDPSPTYSSISFTTSEPSSTHGTPTSKISLGSPETTINATVKVKGYLHCGPVPYATARIRLISNAMFIKDRPNLKHVIDGTETGRDGYFELDGYDHDETSPFQPVIVIYHQCGQLKRYNLTHQSFNIRIPQMYINSKDVFDIGTLNLEPIYPGQKGQVKFEQYSRPLQVRGDLECTTNNAAKKIVQMFASNRKDSNTFIAEEQLERSHFTVNSARAMLTDPFILIAHQCDLTADQVNQDIFRQFNIHIPFYYYNAGRIGLKTFDIGTFNLEVMYPGETLGQIATY